MKLSRRTITLLAMLVCAVVLAPGPSSATASTTKATWYGPCCYGNSVACGGKFNENTISLAVKTGWAPCGTRVRICHKGTCAVLKVRDFCPGCSSGHLFDLSAGLVRRVFGVSPASWGTRTVTYRRMG